MLLQPSVQAKTPIRSRAWGQILGTGLSTRIDSHAPPSYRLRPLCSIKAPCLPPASVCVIALDFASASEFGGTEVI